MKKITFIVLAFFIAIFIGCGEEWQAPEGTTNPPACEGQCPGGVCPAVPGTIQPAIPIAPIPEGVVPNELIPSIEFSFNSGGE